MITGPGGEDSVPVFLMPGEEVRAADGRLLLRVAAAKCLCGDDDPDGCMYLNCGYEYCPKCGDHHRPPACVTVIPGTATS
jgi:hypothetical protein